MLECSQFEQLDGYEMQIKCKCGSKAAIYSRQTLTDTMWKVYAQCKNTKCNRAWPVVCQELDDLRPSELDTVIAINNLLENLPDETRKQLLKEQLKKAS